MQNSEVWKEIKDFPQYSVSSLGRIKNSLTDRELKPYNAGSYLGVSLRKDNTTFKRTVHRIVAETFIENPLKKPTVNHKDGNKKNNFVDNLEWATYHENNLHAYRSLDSSLRRKEQSDRQKGKHHSKEWTEKIAIANSKKVICLNTGVVYSSLHEAEHITGASASKICLVCQGVRKSTKGLRWEYYQEGEKLCKIV